MTIIKPTVGRKVWYRPNDYDKGMMGTHGTEPLDATIVAVLNERLVNLVIFDVNGLMNRRLSVTLLQDGDLIPEAGGYAEWMPYQTQQAKKDAVPVTKSPDDKIEMLLEVPLEDMVRAVNCVNNAGLSSQTIVNFFAIPVTADDVRSFMAHCAYVGAVNDHMKTDEDRREELKNKVSDMMNATQQPVDNEHVEPGAEQFTEFQSGPPTPMAAYSLEDVRWAWRKCIESDGDVTNVIMPDGKYVFDDLTIHAELNARGDGAYCAV